MNKKRILCYGDSNTWGYIPGSDHKRFSEQERWTKVLGNLLGNQYEIIEEGLNSRTLTSNDERPGKEGKSGKDYLIPCLDTHDPIDLVIIMLGTNELKKVFNKSAEVACDEFEEYFVKVILNRKSQITHIAPKLLIIAPVIVTEKDEKYLSAGPKSIIMAEKYEEIANKYNCEFINNKELKTGIDGLHLTVESHKKLAELLYEKIKQVL